MFCRNCGKEIANDSKFCSSCGAGFNNGKKFCQNCGTETQEISDVCLNCGVILAKGQNNSISYNVGDKYYVNWLICLLMSVFFGYFAVDRFMMGQIGLGVLKILSCGGCGVWYIIDIILIATKYKFQNVEWTNNFG
ncbi:MAG: hypothetical protein A2Y34_17960 [Spirochaetes bacterium GWC1_27_15]|nr:MAG: hypothetical protein A2Y34_17960 [Spirochaetes bacterium GWC1_27_15]